MSGLLSKTAAVTTGAAMAFTLATTAILAQRATPAEVAAKFTGTWKINFALSPQFAPDGGGGGRRGGTPSTPSFAVGAVGTRSSANAFQRGGRGGGGGGGATTPSPADLANNAVARELQQVFDTFALTATETSVTFKDARGERTYAVDNKSARIQINGATVNAKSRWDRNILKQEFVVGESRVTYDWELNAEGNRINFKRLVVNMANPGPPAEAKAVYDKQP